MPTPRIALLAPLLTPGDAITNDILGMYEALERSGYEARIYAAETDVQKPKVWHVSKINSFIRASTDILIYHYSIGWEPALQLLRKKKFRRVVKYHNVTPPEFFAPWSEAYEIACRSGRAQLHAIAQTDCDLYLSDSEYNMLELIEYGAQESKSLALPPFHHIDRLSSLDADLSVLNTYRDAKANILMVGRVAPNKGHASLIEAFAIYHRYYNQDSRLLIVGKEDKRLASYSVHLRERAARLKVKDAVVFTGEVTDQELKAYYLLSNIFMIASEHEGFCVPLVEAMAMKLPIVAYGSSAVPQTVDKAGLVWDEHNPHLLAESANFLISDESLSSALGLMGLRRYERHFTNEKIEADFLEALDRLR
ncbi:MAG TPA: glycosyltransferase family 4 protein [Pyrinomonadaceae bacterium]|jgi:glycosyltransferase involved in cell wall biosynthesis